jgi:DNA-binding CsgD family transcriptional regulator
MTGDPVVATVDIGATCQPQTIEEEVAMLTQAPTHDQRRSDRPVCCWGSLTDTERRVAELVAEGLTNREVGERMYISRHTVDFHLRSVYLKLHINSRVQLARLVFEHDRPTTMQETA